MRNKSGKTAERKSLNQRGFTLVEMTIAMIMSGIVLAGIFIIVSGSHSYMLKERDKINLQQDFSLIDEVLARNIREGYYGQQKIYASYADYTASASAQATGTCLKLYFPSGDSIVIYKENSDFKVQKADLSITNLVPDVVDSILFTVGTKSIATYLKLANSGKTIAGDILHVFRNDSTSSADWLYAIFTHNTKKLRLDEGTGTINGDVHSNFDVQSNAGYTINGTITEVTPFVTPPTIDWDFFKTAATNVGQYSTSTLVFDAAGSPYTGVWYTTSYADIMANAVINGTVVAENKIRFKGDGGTITATPSNYPALLCKDWIESDVGNYSGVNITGLVYTDQHFDKDFDNFTLTGAIIALEDFHHNSSNFVVTYDATYLTNLQGISF